MMLGGKNDILHATRLGNSHPFIGIKIHRIEPELQGIIALRTITTPRPADLLAHQGR